MLKKKAEKTGLWNMLYVSTIYIIIKSILTVYEWSRQKMYSGHTKNIYL